MVSAGVCGCMDCVLIIIVSLGIWMVSEGVCGCLDGLKVSVGAWIVSECICRCLLVPNGICWSLDGV